MIGFDVDWADPFVWLTALVLLVLPVVQLRLLLRKSTRSLRKTRLRIALNGLLWLVLVAYVLQPTWKKKIDTTSAIIVGQDVPASLTQRLMDSLKIQERFTAANFKGSFESVTLVGHGFSPELLSRLNQAAIRWIPHTKPNQLQTIRWKGILRQGEMQRVSGTVQSSGRQTLKIKYADQTMDSLELRPGANSFALRFPTFSSGKTQTELVLAGKTLDTLRFFTQPAEPHRFQFILDNPDFESKTLADWLGKNGHSVQVFTTISRNISNRLNINRGGKPDVLITDPGNAAHPIVKRAISEGNAVLFINLTAPEAQLRAINQALGTNWRVKKIANQESVPAGRGLTALPFSFVPALNQRLVPGYPVAVQKTAGTIGVSLLNETFPLKLSGDSTAYARLWQAILAPLYPSGQNNVSVEAPLFNSIQGGIRFNKASVQPAGVRVETDTAQITYSPINPLSAEARYRFTRTGWHTLSDSLAVYVEPIHADDPVAQGQLIRSFLLAHSKYGEQATDQRLGLQRSDEKVPDWFWLTLFIFCLTALWLEPKFS